MKKELFIILFFLFMLVLFYFPSSKATEIDCEYNPKDPRCQDSSQNPPSDNGGNVGGGGGESQQPSPSKPRTAENQQESDCAKYDGDKKACDRIIACKSEEKTYKKKNGFGCESTIKEHKCVPNEEETSCYALGGINKIHDAQAFTTQPANYQTEKDTSDWRFNVYKDKATSPVPEGKSPETLVSQNQDGSCKFYSFSYNMDSFTKEYHIKPNPEGNRLSVINGEEVRVCSYKLDDSDLEEIKTFSGGASSQVSICPDVLEKEIPPEEPCPSTVQRCSVSFLRQQFLYAYTFEIKQDQCQTREVKEVDEGKPLTQEELDEAEREFMAQCEFSNRKGTNAFCKDTATLSLREILEIPTNSLDFRDKSLQHNIINLITEKIRTAPHSQEFFDCTYPPDFTCPADKCQVTFTDDYLGLAYAPKPLVKSSQVLGTFEDTITVTVPNIVILGAPKSKDFKVLQEWILTKVMPIVMPQFLDQLQEQREQLREQSPCTDPSEVHIAVLSSLKPKVKLGIFSVTVKMPFTWTYGCVKPDESNKEWVLIMTGDVKKECLPKST